MSDSRFEQIRLLEALLFASAEPRTAADLARYLPEEADIEDLLGELQQLYANRGVTLRRVGDGWAFRTSEDLAGKLRIERQVTRKLSRAAVETLAIVAYHQPVTRAEVEEIRGVSLNKGTLDVLLEADWIRPRGRRQTPGRPVTWGTTQAFLDHFGLSSVKDLPGIEELKAAGLIDQRPALTALSARGLLTDVGQGEDTDDAENGSGDGGSDADEPERLDPDFGEDLVPETPDETDDEVESGDEAESGAKPSESSSASN